MTHQQDSSAVTSDRKWMQCMRNLWDIRHAEEYMEAPHYGQYQVSMEPQRNDIPGAYDMINAARALLAEITVTTALLTRR